MNLLKDSEKVFFQISIDVEPENEQIESLVSQILKRKTAYASADVTNLERKIDRKVYQLYGLTNDEIRLVEGN